MLCDVGTVTPERNVESHDVGFVTMYRPIVTLAPTPIRICCSIIGSLPFAPMSSSRMESLEDARDTLNRTARGCWGHLRSEE